MSEPNPALHGYFSKPGLWHEEANALRAILLASGLTEERKWGQPCYTFEGSNVAIIGKFKSGIVVTFFKGALLEDPKKILVAPGENTQSARLVRFTSVKEIPKLAPVLKAYIREAIAVEKAGLKVEFKKPEEMPVPQEFQRKLEELPTLRRAFEALTPGRRKAYLLHFSGAKQSKTRESRVEKCIPRILEGKGLDD